MKQKVSYGIALCRNNPLKNNRTEIVMIKKRYTYAFFNFVFGACGRMDKGLQKMFDNMTFAEKIDILSMDFEKLWYRLWLVSPKYLSPIQNLPKLVPTCYIKKQKKFDSLFSKRKRISFLIQNSKNASIPWEIPKGLKKNKEPHDICAMREFEEETSIPHDTYALCSTTPIYHSYVDDGIIYKYVYYVAYLKKKWNPKIDFQNSHQVFETSDIRWVANDEIEFLHLDLKKNCYLKTLFKSIIRVYKKSKKEIKNHTVLDSSNGGNISYLECVLSNIGFR
jgi:8-oxo-dGTP pyrophosphatase MutT (NUDIX family)